MAGSGAEVPREAVRLAPRLECGQHPLRGLGRGRSVHGMSRAAAAVAAPHPASLDVRVGFVAGVRVVEVDGELDLGGAPLLADVLRRPGQHTIVDCRETTFADSTGLATLLGGHRRAFDSGHGYAVVAGRDGLLWRMLEMTGLVQVLAVYDALDEALSALTGR